MSGTRGGSRKGYPLRRHTNGNFSIAVPTFIGRMVPEDVVFQFELVEEGILIRPIRTALPAWIRDQEGEDDE